MLRFLSGILYYSNNKYYNLDTYKDNLHSKLFEYSYQLVCQFKITKQQGKISKILLIMTPLRVTLRTANIANT